MRTRTVFAGQGLGIMPIGVSVGKKIKTLKHCVECVCTLLRWIYIDCSAGPLLGSAVGQLACDRGPKGRENKVTAHSLQGVHADRGPHGRDNKVKPSGARSGDAVWHKISFIMSSFTKWKLIWIYRPQNHLTMEHFNRM